MIRTHRLIWTISAALFLAGLAGAQTTTQINPDCVIPFGISGGSPLVAAGTSTTPTMGGGQNTRYGCFVWRMLYFVNGFSAVSILVQAAPDNSGVPGSWASFSGTACGSPPCLTDGSNPNTSITFAATGLAGGPPWLRVTLSSATGTGGVFGVMYGCRSPGCSTAYGLGGGGSSSACPGTTSTPCVVAGENGSTAEILATDPNGRLLNGVYPSSAAISLSSSGLTQIIAAGSGTTTVAYVELSFTSGVNLQWEYGTGSNCGTGTTPLTGVMQNVLTYTRDTPFLVPTGKALCANLGSAVTGGGSVTYAQP